MAFWTDAVLQDPKRQYRFVVTLGNMPNGATWYAKSVTKPALSITEVEHNFLNHKFYYPGRAEWESVELTLVDPVSPDAAASTAAIIQAGGYTPPSNVNDQRTISKKDATAAINSVTIAQIDSEGNAIETWRLWNPFITSVSYGDLSYDSDEMSEISLTIRYDWAILETAHPAETAGAAAKFAGRREFFKPGSND
tara:strand:- start:325 stop:909 length:585 start_codon:yes stop_codon:yes gene_type:complete